MNRSVVLFSVFLAGAIGWGNPNSWVMSDFGVVPAYADDDDSNGAKGLPGGLTIGGPGLFDGQDGDTATVHTSESAKTLCLTMVGKKGTTEGTFDLGSPLQVVKGETTSICQDNVSTIEMTCIGKCKAQWRVDTVGTDGTDGAQGPAGPQGLPGLQGVAGPAGPQGVQGPQGFPGPQGNPGPAGAQGPQGPAGPAGPQGDAAKWLAGSGVPASNLGEVGDFYLDTDTGVVHEKTGATAWTPQDNLTGPEGPQGIQGVAGPAGPEGPQGPAGPIGPQGPQGPEGQGTTEAEIIAVVQGNARSFSEIGPFVAISPGQRSDVLVVPCPAGRVAVSAGFFGDFNSEFVVERLHIRSNKAEVVVKNVGSTVKRIQATAVCLLF